jgi:hypothetical protein
MSTRAGEKGRKGERETGAIALAVLLCALVFFGCATRSERGSEAMPEVAPGEIMIMSGVDLEVCLMTNGILVSECRMVADDYYAIPTLAWWNKHLPRIVREAQIRDGVEPMDTRDGNDCDNLARHASNAAKRWWYRERLTPEADLAIGELSYTREVGDIRHMSNMGVVQVRPGEYRIGFFEAYNTTTFPTISVWEMDTIVKDSW